MYILGPPPKLNQSLWGCSFTFGNSFWLWPQHGYHWGCLLRQRQDICEDIWNLEIPWFLKAEHSSFSQHPEWPCSSWKALPESFTIITGKAFTAGFPQLLTFRVGKCFVAWGGGRCPGLCRMFSSIPGLYSLETTSIFPSPQFWQPKCLHILPKVSWGGKISPSWELLIYREIFIWRRGAQIFCALMPYLCS